MLFDHYWLKGSLPNTEEQFQYVIKKSAQQFSADYKAVVIGRKICSSDYFVKELLNQMTI